MPSVYFYRLLSLLLLFGLAHSGYAQAPGDQENDQLKARLWYKTATYIWQSRPDKAPRPKPAIWQSLDDMKQWFLSTPGKEDKSGLVALKNAVFKQAKGNYSPRQLADTLISKVRRDKHELQAIKSLGLRQRLDSLLTTAAITSPTPIVITQSAPTGQSVASRDSQSGKVATGEMPAPVPFPTPQGYPGWWLVLAGIIGFLLGMTTTLFIKQQLRKKKKTDFQAASQPNDSGHQETKKQLAEAKRHITKVEDEKKQLEKKYADLRAKRESPQPLANAPISSAPSTEAPTPTTTPAVFYAAEAEGGFLSDADLMPDAASYYALRIKLNANGTQATFDLNPTANQQTLLAYRTTVLREYFDMNIFIGRPTSLHSDRPGYLIREANGWRVDSARKGQLDVR